MNDMDPETLDLFQKFLTQQLTMHGENKSSNGDLAREIKELNALIKTGFADGDLVGHASYHKTLIEKERAKREFWRSLTSSLAEKGITVTIGFLISLLALGAFTKFKAIFQ